MTKDETAKIFFLKPIAVVIGFLGGRPITFWINAMLVAVWLYLLWPLFSPVFVSVIYTIYLITLTLPALGYAYLALIGGAGINTALLIVSFFGFAVAEIYLRLNVPAPEMRSSGSILMDGMHPYYMFTGAPGSTGKMLPQQGGANDVDNIYKLNRLGFRIERPLEKSKPANELRIFVIGGSTVFNGAPLAKTIPGQIESELRRRGFSGATAYNFGVVAAVSGQDLALLTHLLVDYSPDVVISYGGGNDFASPYQHDPRPGFPLNFAALQIGMQALEGKLDLRSALASQLFRSRVVALTFAPRAQELRLPLGALRDAVGYRTPEWETAIIEAYSNNLHRMCRLSGLFNFKFYAVLQPLIFQKSPLTDSEAKIKAGDAAFASYIRRQYQRASVAFHQLQTRDGVNGACRFVDLSRIFANDAQTLFWDFVHVNNDGNGTIASSIADDLANSFLVRGAP